MLLKTVHSNDHHNPDFTEALKCFVMHNATPASITAGHDKVVTVEGLRQGIDLGTCGGTAYHGLLDEILQLVKAAASVTAVLPLHRVLQVLQVVHRLFGILAKL